MIYNFSKIKVVNVDGQPYKKTELLPTHKIIGKRIYDIASNLDLVDVAMEINRGKSVELKHGEAKEIRELLCGKESTLLAFLRKAIIEYMDKVEKDV